MHAAANAASNVVSNQGSLSSASRRYMLKKLKLSCWVTLTWQSQAACARRRHYEPVQANSWSQARNSQEDQLPSHSKWCGHPKSHLDHCCSARRSCNLHPSLCQVPIHSWVHGLVGVVGGRKRRMVNVHLPVVGLDPMTQGQAPTN